MDRFRPGSKRTSMVYCLDFFMGSECTPPEVRNFTMGSECTHPEVRSFSIGSECTMPEVRDFSMGKTLAMSKPHEIVSATSFKRVSQSGISLGPELIIWHRKWRGAEGTFLTTREKSQVPDMERSRRDFFDNSREK